MLAETREKWKRYFKRVFSLGTDPHEIAIGFAIGTFIAIIPSPGVSWLLCLIAIFLYPKMNKVSLVGALVVWNPLTMVPFYLLSYPLGALILGGAAANVTVSGLENESFWQVFSQGWGVLGRYLLGNLLIAVAVSVLCYVAMRAIVIVYQRRKEEKRLREAAVEKREEQELEEETKLDLKEEEAKERRLKKLARGTMGRKH
jgi:uncharacterized protein